MIVQRWAFVTARISETEMGLAKRGLLLLGKRHTPSIAYGECQSQVCAMTAARLYTPRLWSPDICLIKLTHNGKLTQAVYLRPAYARSRCLYSEATIEYGVRQGLNHRYTTRGLR